MKVSTRIAANNTINQARQLQNKRVGFTCLPFIFLAMMMIISFLGKAQLLVEDFTAAPGSLISANGWTAHSGVGTNPITIGAASIAAYPGYPFSGIGNEVSLTTSGEDDNRSFTAQTSGDVYAAFVVNISAANLAGDYFFHLGPNSITTTFSGKVHVKRDASNNLAFGVSKAASSGVSVNYTGFTYALNTTYLLVLKYSIQTGAANDIVTLYINPVLPGTEPGSPTLTALDNTTADLAAIGGVALRQGTAANAATMKLDAIHIGTSWASVTQNPPSITVTGTPLTAVNTTYGSPSATPTSFVVSGANLTADILVTPPAGFEVSQTALGASGYAATQTLAQAGGIVGPITVYVRLAATTAYSGIAYSGNIVLSSAGVTPSVNVVTIPSTVSQLGITITGAVAQDKIYNRNVSAVITGATASGTVNGDIITVTGGGTFADFLVGNTKPVTAALSLSGTNASSYSFSQPTGLTANITQLALTIAGAQAQNKVFDNNNSATITGTLTGVISPDAVSFNGTGTFASSAIGNGIAVTSTSTLTGSGDEANYSLTQPTGLTANITPAGLLPQTITFTLSPTATYGDVPITLNGTASSSLTVSYVSSDPTIASVSGNILTILKPGSVIITASQAGDGTYDAAANVIQPLTIAQKTITITGAIALDKVYDGNTAALIDLTGASLVGVISPDQVSVSGGGTFADPNVANGITVTGNLILGNTDGFKYQLTQPVLSANITQASQTITGLTATDSRHFADVPYTLNATGGASGQPVTYVSSDPTVASVSGNTVTVHTVGVTTITASQAGTTNYSAAADVLQTLTVIKADQTITFNALPNKLTTDGPFTLAATSTSGLLVSYSSSNPAVATISGTTVTIAGAGSTIITANQTGNANYNPAIAVTQTQLVVPVFPFAPVPMATQPGKTYTEDFTNISTWGNAFASGIGANRWKPAPVFAGPIPSATSITALTDTFTVATFQGGVHRGTQMTIPTQSIVLLSTGGTNNTSSTAIDFFMDFTGEIANKLSFDAATIDNPTGDRVGTLKVFASVDGTTWTELLGTNLPYVATDGVVTSASISNIQLPAIFNNNANARLRFYYYNGQAGGSAGSRPLISIDNLTVSALLAPVINSSLTATASVAAAFNYTITATNTPSSYSSSSLPLNGLTLDPVTGVISGIPTASGTYNISITATNAAGADTKTLVLTVGAGAQTITFNALSAKTFGDGAFTLGATASSGLAVSYSSSNTAVATISGNTVTIVGAGNTTITASQAGDANYNAATPVDQVLLVNKAGQTITFNALPNKLDTDIPFTLTAIASSGLTVSYSSSNPAVATVSGNTVTIVAPGTTVITASQAGDANYNAATDVAQSQFIVNTNLLTQTITFAPLANSIYGDAPFLLTATGGGSGNPVTYVSSNTAVATISGNTVTILTPGTTNIIASQAGDVNYNAAPDVTRTLNIDTKALTVSGAVAQPKVYNGTNAAVITGESLVGIVGTDDVTVSGGGTFADVNVASGISVTANLVLGGTKASYYTIIQPTGLTADITPAPQTITFNALPNKTASDVPFALTATASSSLPVSYSSSNTAVATVSGNTVTIVGVGTTTITASQAGNTNYSAATPVDQAQLVTIGSQTITFGPLGTRFTTDAPFALTATASSGLTVSYTSSNPAVATVSGNTVTIVSTGTTTITASQAGNVNFTAATSVPQVLTVVQQFAPVPMAAQPLRTYTENFNDIANWQNGFTAGIGANRWLPVAVNAGTIPSANSITVSSATFSSGTSGGVQKGSAQAPATTSIVLLSINSTDNSTATAIDFFMDFTGLVADKLSFDATTVFNSTGNRVGTLHVYASIDGTSWTELTGTNLPYVATNNVAGSATISNIQLPASFNNSANARLRFYIHNGTGGTTGSRPKISIDNVTVSAVNAPVITNSVLTASGTVDAVFSAYTITATNSPSSYNAIGLPAGLSLTGNTINGTPTVAGTFNVSIQATNAGGTDTKTLVITIAQAAQVITGLPLTDTRNFGDANYNLTATGGASGNPVTYVSSDPLVATISGNTVTITGGGTTTITASQAGNANYLAAADVFQTLTVNKANQTISFAALPNKFDTDGPFSLTATASSGLTVSYTSSNPSVATISGNTVTIVAPGTTLITASQAGNNSYNAAADVSQTQIVINSNAQNQTITFNPLANKIYGDNPFQLTATASSNLPVSYVSSDPTIANISGDMVTILKPGTVNITASQPGDIININPAPDVVQPFTVDPRPLTVAGAVAQDKVYNGNANAIITGATLNNVVSPDVVSVSGGGTFASPNVANGIAVTANLTLGGTDAFKYSIVQPTGLSANITIASQTITFGPLAPMLTTDIPFALTASASSGLTVSYSSSNTAVATVSGNTVTIVGDGSTIITATQAGNGNYTAASPVSQTLVVNPAPATVTWNFGIASGNAAPSSVIPAGLSVSNVSQGNNNGTTTMLSNVSASNIYAGASGAFNASASSVSGGLSARSGTSTYFEFTLTPLFHKRVTLSSISFGSRSAITGGPLSYTLRSSLDNFTADLASGTTVNNNTWGLRSPSTTASTSNYGSAVTYRLYGYDGTGGTANVSNWKIDDLALTLLMESAPPCAGTPTAGTATAGTGSFCLTGSTTLTLSGYTDPGSVTGIGLQWYSSTDNITFNPIGGETNPTLSTGTITQTTYYYCTVSCSGSGQSANSNTVTVTIIPSVNPGTVTGTSPLCIGSTATYSSNGDGGGLWSSSFPLIASVNPTTGLVTALTAGTTSIIYTVTGCGGPLAASQSLTVSPNASAGTVSGTSPLCIGSSATYSSDGDAGGVWSSTFPLIASVNPTTGFVTALATGTTDITYTTVGGCNGPVSSFATLTVSANASAGTVSGTSPLCIGSTATYSSNGDAGGVWSSTFAAIASVNPATGLVTALATGTTDITYTTVGGCNGPSSSFATLTVSPNANAGTVSGTSPLCIGSTATYSSDGDAGGVWSSTFPLIASVNPATGFVTALATGTTDITYTTVGGCNGPSSSFATLTVSPNASAGTVNGTSPLCIGSTATYSSDGDAGGVWSSTFPAIASVNPATGFVTALAAGTTDITYTTVGGCNGPVSSFATLTVSPNANPGTVSGTSPLCIGSTATYSSNGDAGGVWSSTFPAIASVNPATGLVTALATGTTDITYTTVGGCNGPSSSFATLTVSPNANAGTVSGTSPLCIGSTTTYSSTGDGGGIWSSTSPGIASVDPSTGFVTALATGSTDITYTTVGGCNGPVSSFATLTVSPNASAGTVSGTSPLCIGSTATYSSNGDAGGVWSSTFPAIASVNPTTGFVTALATGTTDITYTTVGGCNGPVSSFATLTVSANASAGTVSGTSPLCIGSTATYSSNGDGGGIWSSTSPGIASVDPSTGFVTALAAGTTDITYTTVGGCNGPLSSFATLTVSPNANAGTVSGTSPLCIGSTATYSSDGDAGGVWSSTFPLITSVNPTTGLVTALSTGTTDITYTTVGGCNGPVSSFATLTVSPNANPGTVSGTSPLCIGSTATYSSNGDAGGVWSSTFPAIASVNPTTGFVTALAAGTTDITYTVNTGCNNPFSAFATLTVNPIPPAPSINGVNNNNGTSTLTATGFTGTLLWSTNATTTSITVASAGMYTVTQTVLGCTSLPGSIIITPDIVADPAITGLDLTDMSDVSIPNANQAPLNQVLKLKVPVFNLNQANYIPAGATTLRIDLGSKFIVDPGFTLSSATLNNYFNWTQTIEAGHVVIYGDQYATIPEDFDGIAVFQVISNTTCSSVINASILVDNHANSITLIDEDAANNSAALNYSITIPALVYTVTQPTCATATGTISITAPTETGMTYSVDGLDYTNTTGLFTSLVPGTYHVTAKTVDGCITPISIVVIDPQPLTPTNIFYTVTAPTCLIATGTITINSPLGAGLSYSIDGSDYSNTSGVFSGLTPGSYNLTVKAAGPGGCISTITVAVVPPQPVTPTTISFSVIQPDCATATGTITISAPTGLNYSIDGLDYTNTTGVFTNLIPGSYNLTVKTAAGCISPITVATVNAQPLTPTITLGAIQSTGCSGAPVGSITVTAGGAPGPFTYTIAGPTVNTTGHLTGVFTGLSAGNYTVTVFSTSGCSNSISATVVGPVGVLPDISLGADFSSNFFFSVGDVNTIVYNIAEVAGNPATGDTLRITKVPGYTISFNPALTVNPIGINTLDNPRWKLINSASFVSIVFDPNHNSTPGTLNCGERVYIAVDLTRVTSNISIFSLSSRLRKANSETFLVNNLASILFSAE